MTTKRSPIDSQREVAEEGEASQHQSKRQRTESRRDVTAPSVASDAEDSSDEGIVNISIKLGRQVANCNQFFTGLPKPYSSNKYCTMQNKHTMHFIPEYLSPNSKKY